MATARTVARPCDRNRREALKPTGVEPTIRAMTMYPDGLGGGLETTRSYLAEEFATGSPRTVTRWLRTLVGREDVVRVWLTPAGAKATIWSHVGPLHEVPDLESLLTADAAEPVAA